MVLNRSTNLTLRLGFSIPGSRIPGSRPIFSIPNPGIDDALIPGFRDYKNYKLHADKAKFGAYFCPNFVEFAAYILRCLCVFVYYNIHNHNSQLHAIGLYYP